jgi:hypothetical protein
MEAVNAVDNPTTKKGKTRQDTINKGDFINKWTVNNEISHFGNQPYMECNHPPTKCQ